MFVTYTIMGATVLVSMLAFNRPTLMMGFMMNPYKIATEGQYYRFITSGFIHQDHMHLLWNMLSLYFFGRVVEVTFGNLFGDWGAIYYIALYILAIIVSDLPSYFKKRNQPNFNSLGASGGVAAVIFAFILFYPLDKICLYFAFCIQGFILGIAYVMYSYYQGKRANDNINHDAHLYGAAFGFIFCIIMYPPAITNFIQEIANWKIFE